MGRGKHRNHKNNNQGSRGGYRGARGGGQGRGREGEDPLDDDFSIYDGANNAPRGSGMNTPNYRGGGRGANGSGLGEPRRGPSTPRGTHTPRRRGRPQYNTNYDDVDPGMGRGRGSPADRGRGRGRGGAKGLPAKLRAGAPLGRLLDADRPLLRPIVFVRSVYTATLFEDEEDVFKPLAEDVANDEESHAPTASQVNRVFGTADDDEEGQLEEIDFTEIGRLQAEVDAAAANNTFTTKEAVTVVEEKFMGFYVDTQPAPVTTSALRDAREVLGEEDDDYEVIVYVAPHPRAGPATPPAEEHVPGTLPTASILTGLALSAPTQMFADANGPRDVEDAPANRTTAHEPDSEDIGGQTEDAMREDHAEAATKPFTAAAVEDQMMLAPSEVAAESIPESALDTPPASIPTSEAIAPLPERPADATPSDLPADAAPSALPTVSDVSFAFSHKKLARRLHPVHTPRALIKNRFKARRKLLPRPFVSFGASLAEAQLRGEDPRRDERRMGDSDLEWGDEEKDRMADAVEELSTGVGDMQVDDELDVKAMKRFVQSMSAEGSRTVTMDDIADEEMLRAEDAEGLGGAEGSSAGESDSDEDGEDSEVEAVMRKEEGTLIAEGAEAADLEGSDEEGETSSDGEFDSPNRGFQARLHRIRENANGKGKAKAVNPPDSDEDDEDYEIELDGTWADKDESFMGHIQKLVDEGQEILSRKQRKARNKRFRAIQDGEIDIDEYEEMMGRPAVPKKDKAAHLPPELAAQWEADRAKKAENKRLRAEQRLQAASDPLAVNKGGKKGMKATVAAMRYAGSDADELLPHRVTDLVSLEAQIRRFVADADETSMSLPPADKRTRRRVHELADAFSLKSQSKGKGTTRYTTLTKTSRSGLDVNEKKVKRVLRESGAWDWQGPAGKEGKKMSLAKHQEGEEVGKAAPKLTEANRGFRMLASMGWAEGERIGLSGGLDVPLVAKMKKTKLGLGASVV